MNTKTFHEEQTFFIVENDPIFTARIARIKKVFREYAKTGMTDANNHSMVLVEKNGDLSFSAVRKNNPSSSVVYYKKMPKCLQGFISPTEFGMIFFQPGIFGFSKGESLFGAICDYLRGSLRKYYASNECISFWQQHNISLSAAKLLVKWAEEFNEKKSKINAA